MQYPCRTVLITDSVLHPETHKSDEYDQMVEDVNGLMEVFKAGYTNIKSALVATKLIHSEKIKIEMEQKITNYFTLSDEFEIWKKTKSSPFPKYNDYINAMDIYDAIAPEIEDEFKNILKSSDVDRVLKLDDIIYNNGIKGTVDKIDNIKVKLGSSVISQGKLIDSLDSYAPFRKYLGDIEYNKLLDHLNTEKAKLDTILKTVNEAANENSINSKKQLFEIISQKSNDYVATQKTKLISRMVTIAEAVGITINTFSLGFKIYFLASDNQTESYHRKRQQLVLLKSYLKNDTEFQNAADDRTEYIDKLQGIEWDGNVINYQ